MPKVARNADPLVCEAAASKHARLSSSSSPSVPNLSMHQLSQCTQVSSEEPQISSPSNHVFPTLSAISKACSDLITPGSLSPSSQISMDASVDKTKAAECSNLSKGESSSHEYVSNISLPDITGKDNCILKGHNRCSMQQSNNIPIEEENLHEDPDDCDCEPEGPEGCRVTDRKSNESVDDGKIQCTEKADSSEARFELTSQGGEKAHEATTCALTGFVTLAARNGDSLMHGMLPSVIPHNQVAALNSCFPRGDGNWYQIISASIPPLLSSQHVVENTNHMQTSTVTTSTDTKQCEVSAGFSPLNCLSSLSMASTTATSSGLVTPIATPVTTADPLLSYLQHCTAGSACSPDIQTSLSAIHLPVNLAAAAGVPSPNSPRYIYATNPRTGQLLILSSVGDLNGVQALQQLQLQQQLPLHQVMHMQQQQMKLQEKTAWKSPLQLNQHQNFQTSPSSGTALGKQRAKSDSIVAQLLHAKSNTNLGNQDENMPSVAAAQELLALASPARSQGMGQGTMPPPLFQGSDKPADEPVRENHNMKERRRRARIKDACDLMRQLVPGMSEKTDKATVFEFSARYIHFLKNFVGTHHDKDFLIKYSPY